MRTPAPLPSGALRGLKADFHELQERFWGVYEGLRRPPQKGSGNGGVWKDGQTYVAIWRYLGEDIDGDWNEQYAVDEGGEQWERAELLPRITESLPAEVLYHRLQAKYPNGEWFQLQFFRPNVQGKTLPASEPLIVYVEEAESEIMKENAKLTDFASFAFKEKQEAERRAKSVEARLRDIEEAKQRAIEHERDAAAEAAKEAEHRAKSMESGAIGAMMGLFERLIPQQQGNLSRGDLREMIADALDKHTSQRRDHEDDPGYFYPPNYPYYPPQDDKTDRLIEAINQSQQRNFDLTLKMFEMQQRLQQPAQQPSDPWDMFNRNPIMAKMLDKFMDKAFSGDGSQVGDPLSHPVFGRFLQQAIDRGFQQQPVSQDTGVWGQIAQGITTAVTPIIQQKLAGGTATQEFVNQVAQTPPALPPTPPRHTPPALPPAAPTAPPPPVSIPTARTENPTPAPTSIDPPPPTPTSVPQANPTANTDSAAMTQSRSILDAIEVAIEKNIDPDHFAASIPDAVIDETAASFCLSRQELGDHFSSLWTLAKSHGAGPKTRSLRGKQWIDKAAIALKARLQDQP